MLRLKYVGKYDEVECLGRVVKRGEAADFTAAEAGRAPSDDDLGTGLLAQPDNWQLVKAAEKKGA
jgi:hypothetical protein